MTVSVTDQALFFAGALVDGAAGGAAVRRVPHPPCARPPPPAGWSAGPAVLAGGHRRLFVYTTTAGSGEVRLYIVAAVLLGAAAYFWLLSRWFLKLGYRLADLVGVLWRVLTLPVVFLLRLCKKSEKPQKSPSIIGESGIE